MYDEPRDLLQSNKPLMEKRRRERINSCLDQLKSILMEVTKKEVSSRVNYIREAKLVNARLFFFFFFSFFFFFFFFFLFFYFFPIQSFSGICPHNPSTCSPSLLFFCFCVVLVNYLPILHGMFRWPSSNIHKAPPSVTLLTYSPLRLSLVLIVFCRVAHPSQRHCFICLSYLLLFLACL